MNEYRPPQIDLDFNAVPNDANVRHEALLDVLGQYIMWLRNWSVDSSKRVIEASDSAEKLGAIRWKRYADVATMTRDQQYAACQFAEATVDRFILLLLTMISGTGVDQRLGSSHAVRFKLDIEILDVESRETVASETLNRGGRKFFADYWGRWLNRFSASSTTSDSERKHATE
jgi:hypothetical protein